jgi:PEP-CTERM motif
MKSRTTDLLSTGIALLCLAVPAFAGIPVVPEPTTVLLIGGGLGAILVVRHLRAKKK